MPVTGSAYPAFNGAGRAGSRWGKERKKPEEHCDQAKASSVTKRRRKSVKGADRFCQNPYKKRGEGKRGVRRSSMQRGMQERE